jgi:hypothetical protein
MTAVEKYNIGDRVYFTARYRDTKTGKPVDADAGVKCWVRAPDGTVTELTVTVEDGVATANHIVTEAGTWAYAFEWPSEEASEEEFVVLKQKVPH